MAADALGHRSAVREQQTEDARLTRAPHVKADRRDPPDDLSGSPDDDHDAEAEAHGEPSLRGRP